MEVLLILILLIAFGVYLFFNSNKKTSTKDSGLKKDELIQKYHNDLLILRSSCDGDEELFKEKKLEYLKKASLELHNNIFFTDDEVKAIIKDLASF